MFNKVPDNERYPPAVAVGNNTSILNTLNSFPCCPYSNQQHYFSVNSRTFSELTNRLKNIDVVIRIALAYIAYQ